MQIFGFSFIFYRFWSIHCKILDFPYTITTQQKSSTVTCSFLYIPAYYDIMLLWNLVKFVSQAERLKIKGRYLDHSECHCCIIAMHQLCLVIKYQWFIGWTPQCCKVASFMRQRKIVDFRAFVFGDPSLGSLPHNCYRP